MLTRQRAAALLIMLALITPGAAVPTAAAGGTTCRTLPSGQQVCEVTATPTPSPGTSTSGGGSSSAKKVTCKLLDEPIDCTTDEGTWSNTRACWVAVIDPAPPADDPRWEGNTDGAVYRCWPPGTGTGGAIGGITFFWAAAPPPAVNPSRLAREAVDSMNLVPPTVGATPRPTPEAVSLIGLPTWLWIDGADEHSWGPITRTASAGGVTVTATAKVAKVVWDMGDGNTVTCTNKGTEWTPAKGTGDSPTCGLPLQQPR